MSGYAGADETPEWEDDEDTVRTESGVVPTDFDSRVRMLLGVKDPTAQVLSSRDEGETGTDSTIESWESTTISCAGKSLEIEGYDSLPRMLRRLEHADKERAYATARRILSAAHPELSADAVYAIHLDRSDTPLLGTVDAKTGMTLIVTCTTGQRCRSHRDLTGHHFLNVHFDITHITEWTPNA